MTIEPAAMASAAPPATVRAGSWTRRGLEALGSLRDATVDLEHQAVAGPQELRQIAEGGVLPAPLVAEEHQHARGGAVLQRALCDQLLGQGIIEVG